MGPIELFEIAIAICAAWIIVSAVVRGFNSRATKFRSNTSGRRSPMRDEFASYSFRAVTAAGLVLLLTGLVAIAFT